MSFGYKHQFTLNGAANSISHSLFLNTYRFNVRDNGLHQELSDLKLGHSLSLKRVGVECSMVFETG